MSLLGSWQTWFPISERNYFGANIWVPAQLINGTVLMPGQSFDWWDAIWPVTPARGFGPGGVIAGDHTEPTGALGGGMCSSSTTLFNAAMRAGLHINARSNHKYYINRYPLGLDATVSITGGGRQTMSFRTTRRIIFIRGFRIRRAASAGCATRSGASRTGGRSASRARASSNVSQATTKTVYVDDLPKGTKEQVEYPSDGMTVVGRRGSSRTRRAACSTAIRGRRATSSGTGSSTSAGSAGWRLRSALRVPYRPISRGPASSQARGVRWANNE